MRQIQCVAIENTTIENIAILMDIAISQDCFALLKSYASRSSSRVNINAVSTTATLNTK